MDPVKLHPFSIDSLTSPERNPPVVSPENHGNKNAATVINHNDPLVTMEKNRFDPSMYLFNPGLNPIYYQIPNLFPIATTENESCHRKSPRKQPPVKNLDTQNAISDQTTRIPNFSMDALIPHIFESYYSSGSCDQTETNIMSPPFKRIKLHEHCEESSKSRDVNTSRSDSPVTTRSNTSNNRDESSRSSSPDGSSSTLDSATNFEVDTITYREQSVKLPQATCSYSTHPKGATTCREQTLNSACRDSTPPLAATTSKDLDLGATGSNSIFTSCSEQSFKQAHARKDLVGSQATTSSKESHGLGLTRSDLTLAQASTTCKDLREEQLKTIYNDPALIQTGTNYSNTSLSQVTTLQSLRNMDHLLMEHPFPRLSRPLSSSPSQSPSPDGDSGKESPEPLSSSATFTTQLMPSCPRPRSVTPEPIRVPQICAKIEGRSYPRKRPRDTEDEYQLPSRKHVIRQDTSVSGQATLEEFKLSTRQLNAVKRDCEQHQPEDNDDIHKPIHSYIALISKAILSHPQKRMILSDIYQYIMDNFPFYNNDGKAWRNSIRHNLSLNECFVKVGRAENGKGNYWSIHPSCVDDFAKGDYRRRQARRRARSVATPPLALDPRAAAVAAAVARHHSPGFGLAPGPGVFAPRPPRSVAMTAGGGPRSVPVNRLSTSSESCKSNNNQPFNIQCNLGYVPMATTTVRDSAFYPYLGQTCIPNYNFLHQTGTLMPPGALIPPMYPAHLIAMGAGSYNRKLSPVKPERPSDSPSPLDSYSSQSTPPLPTVPPGGMQGIFPPTNAFRIPGLPGHMAPMW